MTEQSQAPRDGRQLSEPESRFTRRWRELVERAGGQKKVVSRLGWTKSTVSRDCTGETQPTDERVRQLCDRLELSSEESGELWSLLEQARQARYERKRAAEAPREAADPSPDLAARGKVTRPWPRGREQLIALVAAGVLVGLVTTVTVLLLGGHRQAAGGPTAQGSYPGMPIRAVAIAKSSLTPALARAFTQGQTAARGSINGYVFRNMKGPSLCLTAVDTGSAAGENRDRVEVATCDGAADQVWIPEQWETDGARFTQLINYRYQSKCLNADNIGGLANGHKTQLWDCYQSPNEYWDFGDWFGNVKSGVHAYPIFVDSGRLCLDADKFDFRDGTPVSIWTQYQAANQFWSHCPKVFGLMALGV